MYIFVNNNTNLNFVKILSNYTIWDRLSQKTVSRYCPFKETKKMDAHSAKSSDDEKSSFTIIYSILSGFNGL